MNLRSSEMPIFYKEKDWEKELSDPWQNIAREYPKLGLAENEKVAELARWYRGMVASFPEYSLEKATLDSDAWTTVYSSTEDKKGELLEIKRFDDEFFSLMAVRCKKTMPDGSVVWWDQPVMVCKETPLKLKIFGQEMVKPIYGVLAVVRDSEDNYLVTVGQEATSENEKHAVVRLPVQASSGKIARMVAGKSSDTGIEELMRSFGCNNVGELISKAEQVVLESPEDPDRVKKHNVVMIMPKVDVTSDFHRQLESDGKRMWVNKEQWDALVYAGLANSHTVLGVDAAKRMDRMEKYK